MPRLPGTSRTPPATGLPGVWRATVASTGPLMITITRLTGSSPVGPCEQADFSWISNHSSVNYPALKAGDPVWAIPIEGRRDSFAVIARR